MGSRAADCLDKDECYCWIEGVVLLILFPQTIPAKVRVIVSIYLTNGVNETGFWGVSPSVAS